MTDHRFTLLDALFDQVVATAAAGLPALTVEKQFRAEGPRPFCAIYLGPSDIQPFADDFTEPVRAPSALRAYDVVTSFFLATIESDTVSLRQISPVILDALDVLRRSGVADAAWGLSGIGPPQDDIEDIADIEMEMIEVASRWNATPTLELLGT